MYSVFVIYKILIQNPLDLREKPIVRDPNFQHFNEYFETLHTVTFSKHSKPTIESPNVKFSPYHSSK